MVGLRIIHARVEEFVDQYFGCFSVLEEASGDKLGIVPLVALQLGMCVHRNFQLVHGKREHEIEDGLPPLQSIVHRLLRELVTSRRILFQRSEERQMGKFIQRRAIDRVVAQGNERCPGELLEYPSYGSATVLIRAV